MQLQLIDGFLRKNKLTLNYSKTTYLLFNKQPNVQSAVNSPYFWIKQKKKWICEIL